MNTQSAEQGTAPTIPGHVTFLWAVNLAWTVILLYANLLECLRGGQWSYQAPGSLIYFATLAAYPVLHFISGGSRNKEDWVTLITSRRLSPAVQIM